MAWAKPAGSATITALAGGQVGTCTVIVVAVSATGLLTAVAKVSSLAMPRSSDTSHKTVGITKRLEPVRHFSANEDSLCAYTDLPRVPEAVPDREGGGLVHVGVVQHDHGILSTQLQDDPLQVASRRGEDVSVALNQREVGLYSDLLLHDMGAGLSDVCGPEAAPGEYRTARLWGLRHRTAFLHDGRASTPLEAIEAHGGEADAIREAFPGLAEGQKAMLLRFLASL